MQLKTRLVIYFCVEMRRSMLYNGMTAMEHVCVCSSWEKLLL